MKNSIWIKYSYFWITLVLGSLLGHWIFAWFAYVQEQSAHAQSIDSPNFCS